MFLLPLNIYSSMYMHVLIIFCIFQILTKDSVTVVVDAVVYAKIHDATMSVVNIEDARASTHLLGATTLRTILGTIGLSELLSDRERIDRVMQVSFI